MKVLTLDADDVMSACPMKECIDEVSRAFALLAEGKVQSPSRARLAMPSGDVLVMPSVVERGKFEASVKVVSIFPDNKGKTPSITGTVILLDGETGVARAILEGTKLTAIRTGAVSGLSCRFLARRDSKRLGIIGAGGQAFQQVRGVLTALPEIAKVSIFSRHQAKSKALARECFKALKVEGQVEESANDCVEGSDVVVTATTSTTPVFNGEHVDEGTHVIAIGSYRPEVRELDSSLVSRASIFVDSKKDALDEAGDLIIPMKEGVIGRDSVKAELSELVTGSRQGRRSGSEVTLFKSVGLAFEDNAAGWLAFRRARRQKIGKWSEL